jgi:hypothetical protein
MKLNRAATSPFQLVRFVNALLLVTLIILALTGIFGLFWSRVQWVFDVHRLAGWVLILLIPWKAGISWRSLRRGVRWTFDRGVMIFLSLFLSIISVFVIILGIAWLWRVGPAEAWLRQTVISWHWMLGLGLLAPLLIHVYRRWPKPRQVDFSSRRGVLKMIGIGAGSVAAWWSAEWLANEISQSAAPRRHTGSRQGESFSGNQFPVTHSAGEGEIHIDPSAWKLVGHYPGDNPGDNPGDYPQPEPYEWSYEALLALPRSDLRATIDCTLGWYSIQEWQGIALHDLMPAVLQPDVIGVAFESITGYRKALPIDEARQVRLATHVGGEVLDHWHGYPVRLVVPSRRGWYWVKWLTTIEILTISSIQGWFKARSL